MSSDKNFPDTISVHLLLLDSDGRRMLVRDCSGRIPSFSVSPAFYPEVEEIVERVRAELDLEIAILRCLAEGDANEGRPRMYSALSVSDNNAPVSGYRWSSLDEPNFDDGAREELASIARVEVDRLASDSRFDSHAPWDSPTGWHLRARDWVDSNMPPAPSGLSWRMSQIRSWSISSVWRLSSGRHRVYFKSSPRFFASEVAVTRDVATRFPEISPVLIASDPDEGWMLMEDLGDLTLSKSDDPDMWRETMKTIALAQRGYIERTGALERMGIESRTTEAIVETLADWIGEPSRTSLRMFQPENEAALRRLSPRLDEIKTVQRRLDDLGLPRTLEHGDLDSTNVFIRDGSPILMDWSDACVSHPFFTPLTPAQARRHPEFVDAYLREWPEIGAIERLRAGFMRAKPLAALESAFHYHRNIVPYMSYPYPDFRTLERYIPALLEMALDALDHIPKGD